ncbi:MAG: nucleotidyl transferase AbiEii/AbiGii toxin family protein [Oligoflexales bacterium]|nr:nucleotidyl transferase AbiEii/AbiGii toxin family protein [Oligoflexales bacterium]
MLFNVSLRYKFDSLIIDLVPFGGVESPGGQITWTDDGQVVSTVGFDEAHQSSRKLTIPNSDREIKIAKLAGLYLMKCISWNDRPNERSRDVFDMNSILNKYIEAGQMHRIYEQDQDLLEIPTFTLEKASAALLGRDLKKLCKQKSFIEEKKILQREINLSNKSLFIQQLSSFFQAIFNFMA